MDNNEPYFYVVSTHTPPARCDAVAILKLHFLLSFLLTHLLRGVTKGRDSWDRPVYVSTHTPPARCDLNAFSSPWMPWVSTHTPPARCDTAPGGEPGPKKVSTHTPPARCDCNILLSKTRTHSKYRKRTLMISFFDFILPQIRLFFQRSSLYFFNHLSFASLFKLIITLFGLKFSLASYLLTPVYNFLIFEK